MQFVINVPDSLPQARVEQVIREVEDKLREEASLVSKSDNVEKLLQWCDEHQFTLEGDIIPSREERNAR